MRRASIQSGLVGGPGVALPVVTFSSPTPGPCVVVGANLHGDEANGLGIAHQLIRVLPALLARGSVHIYPSLNPKGLEEGTRRLPGDALDPNRAFPGSARGSAAQRHAARIWSDLLARRPDLYIDLHTDASGAIPYAIVDRVIAEGGSHPPRSLGARALELAEATGLVTLREYPLDRYRRFELDRSLPGALLNGPGILAFTLEVGPRRWVDPSAVPLGTGAVLGVLSALKMADVPARVHPSRRHPGIWRRESGPRTTRGGILVPLLSPGERFSAREIIAEVREVSGEVKEALRAPGEGFIVALPELTFAAAGTACATLAVPEEAPV